MPAQDRELWKQTAIFLSGVLLTALVALFTVSGGNVSATEVRTMIQNESPYVEDRAVIRGMADAVLRVESRLRDVEREVSVIRGNLERADRE